MNKAIRKQKAGAIRYWKGRKARYDFVRKNLKKIVALSFNGWPRMTKNRDYPKWLDIVYAAKGKGVFSHKSANCDVIANLYYKAKDIQRERQGEAGGQPRG